MSSVYSFGAGQADGDATMSAILGGKGANLHEMTRLGIPVPPGLTIPATECGDYLRRGSLSDTTRASIEYAVRLVEERTGRKFGDPTHPLLLSVRSGAQISMPGMMDTILNLGLTDTTANGLAAETGDPRFAADAHRRFLQMYAEVALDLAPHHDAFETILDEAKASAAVSRDCDLDADQLTDVTRRFKSFIVDTINQPFPDDPWEQLWRAIEAVFRSWEAPRARAYRRVHEIAEDLGTAVTVMAMVFGNLGDDSGTGVVFSRNPASGASGLYGEFLVNAQGEDVVAGIRTPQPIATMADVLPDAYAALHDTCGRLERHFGDMQDIEFTVERGQLYLLQTRAAKRTAHAAVRVAVDMVDEGVLDRDTALTRVDANQLDQLLHATVDPAATADLFTTGLPASPGAATGRLVFDADTAHEQGTRGEPVVLVRRETTPDDFHGMVAAVALVTERGGMTSHAAVVARGMGKCCVAGCSNMRVDADQRTLQAGDRTLHAGDWVTVDGSAGRVLIGQVPLVEAEAGPAFDQIMRWVDERRRLRVRANADTAEDARRARAFGAEGIGLCRTEHMFFSEDRLHLVREMILARTDVERASALDRLGPIQRDDFAAIFETMDNLPVTIRLLDPPLHEFLPHGEVEIRELADRLGRSEDEVEALVDGLHEDNPMLGHRGCRLGITHPDITAMQATAIFEAAVEVSARGVDVRPEIMVPLVSEVEELRRQIAVIRGAAEAVFAATNRSIEYQVGTMIELPRAALTAGALATEASFFSFGTNDLTQTTFGLSRDDAGRFLPAYVDAGVLPANPFQTLDKAGVGRLVEIGVREGRAAKPDLKIGICGEHGGDPRSIAFCHDLGMNYVSCSPFRVPAARLAAAQAVIAHTRLPLTAAPRSRAPAAVAASDNQSENPSVPTGHSPPAG